MPMRKGLQSALCICALCAASAVLAALPVAAGDDIPRYDPSAYCDELAGFGGAYSETARDGCMDMEQSSYDSLKAEWAGLSPRIRRYCDELATFGGKGSYMAFKGCVDMEKGAAARNRTREFKY
jgi:hypothetical protein